MSLCRPNNEETTDNSSKYPSLKSISISTKAPVNPNQPNHNYQHVNHLLLAIHKERYGDPEIRESWWKEENEDVDMEESQPIYANANALLREAFLHRRQQ